MKSHRIARCAFVVLCLFAMPAAACEHKVTVGAVLRSPEVVCAGSFASVEATPAFCDVSGCSIESYVWMLLVPDFIPVSDTSDRFSCTLPGPGVYAIQVTATCAGNISGQASVNVTAIGVASVSAGGVTSETNNPGASETVYVAKGSPGATIPVTAAPIPSVAWPSGRPTWKFGEDTQTTTGSSISFPIHTAGTTTVTATCGTSSCAINIVVVEIVSLQSDKEVVGVGEDVDFSVETSPIDYYNDINWSGGGSPATQSGGQIFTTSWNTPGTKTVTASCGSSSISKEVEVIEGLTVVPRNAYVGVEGQKSLAAWTFENGSAIDVTSSSTFTTSKGDFNGNVLTASPAPSDSIGADWVKATYDDVTTDADYDCDLTVIKVEIDSIVDDPNDPICDGLRVDIDLIVTPEDGKNYIASIELVALVPEGVTNYGNPEGEGLTFSQRGDITQWQIDNTRWYSIQPCHCNDDSVWEIKATYSFGESNSTTNTVTFKASAGPDCVQGGADIKVEEGEPQIWSGEIETPTVQLPNGKWQATITQGTFKRDVKATYDLNCEETSQFYDMVLAEELFHVGQIEGTNSSTVFSHLWNALSVMYRATAKEPFEEETKEDAIFRANNAFELAKMNEEYWSKIEMILPHPTRCAAESEAKSESGASYRLTMPCAYPECP